MNMTDPINNLNDGRETSSYSGCSWCVIHNPPSYGETDHSEGNTSKEKLEFLIEERDKCLKKLEEFAQGGNIKFPYHVYHHPPVYTCEEAAKFCPTIDGGLRCGEMKNLFLVDKKKKFYMISALLDTNVDLKSLSLVLGAKGGVRFGNEAQLKQVLNLVPGSVSPFGLLNDKECLVKYYLDNKAYEFREHLGFHPNSCNSTVAIQKDDFIKLIEHPAMGSHKMNIIDLENRKVVGK